MIFVDADDGGVAPFDALDPVRVRLHKAGLHVLNRVYGAAHGVDLCELGAGAFLELRNLGVDGGIAIEKIGVFEKIGLKRQDLLHAKRPLLVPRAGQAEGLVPCG